MASKKGIEAGRAYVKAYWDDNALLRGLKGLRGTVASAGRAIGRALSIGVAAGVAASSLLIKSAIQKAADMQITTTAFETMLGDATKAAALIGKLRELGAKTPFGRKDLIDATRVLLQFGAGAEEAYDSVRMLSNVAAGDAQKLGSLALVFGQIRSAGKLTGGDLLQLINVGFNPLQSIAEKTGESMSALRDRMSRGAISFGEVKQAFIDATSEGGRFYQMNEKMSETVAGRWAAMQDAWDMAMTGMGTAMLPFVESAMTYLETITDGFDITAGNIGTIWGRLMEGLVNQLSFVGDALDRKVLQWSANLREGIADSVAHIPWMTDWAESLRRAAGKDRAGVAEIDKRVHDAMFGAERKPLPNPADVAPAKPVEDQPESTAAMQNAAFAAAMRDQSKFDIFDPHNIGRDTAKEGFDRVNAILGISTGPSSSSGTFSGRGAAFMGGSNPIAEKMDEQTRILKGIKDNTEDGMTWGA